MKELEFDLVIVGAGPAGCACAYQLRNENLRIALIDKSKFPRDKICGDGFSADVINQFHRMDPSLADRFDGLAEKMPSFGVRFFAPNANKLDVPFGRPKHGDAPGYVIKRIDFDHFWFKQIEKQKNLTILLEEKLQKATINADSVEIETEHYRINSKLIIGADGAQSAVSRLLAKSKPDKESNCGSLRQYYKGVEGMNNQNFIELHFYQDILPGYFWIFPLPNGQANVGIGMLSSEISKRKIDLKVKLEEIIQNHPKVKDRFKNASPLEKPRGFGIPIGKKKKSISGERYLLLGDAANLVDPFTGEGIGNAIRSGRLAAEHILKAFELKKFDSKFNYNYDKLIYNAVWKELKLSASLLKMLKYPWLFNWVVKKASTNPSIQLLMTSMLEDIDLKKELVKPSFYFKLIFK